MYVKLINVFYGIEKNESSEESKKSKPFLQISIAMYGKYKNLKQIENFFNNYNTPSIDYNYF